MHLQMSSEQLLKVKDQRVQNVGRLWSTTTSAARTTVSIRSTAVAWQEEVQWRLLMYLVIIIMNKQYLHANEVHSINFIHSNHRTCHQLNSFSDRSTAKCQLQILNLTDNR